MEESNTFPAITYKHLPNVISHLPTGKFSHPYFMYWGPFTNMD